MNYTTQIFTFVFFPIAIGMFFLIHMLMEKKKRESRILFEQIALILFSFAFYGFAGWRGVIFLFMYSSVVYAEGFVSMKLCSQREGSAAASGNKVKRGHPGVVLGLLIIPLVLLLYIYKYLGFTIEVLNSVTGSDRVVEFILIPAGISFITFSALSYLIDIYRGDAERGSYIDCLLYITFFPKLIAGPIVQWRDFKPQLESRMPSADRFYRGMNRMMIGYAKKIILADFFGATVALIRGQGCGGIDLPTAWLCSVLYTLEIYYDFWDIRILQLALPICSDLNLRRISNFHICLHR